MNDRDVSFRTKKEYNFLGAFLGFSAQRKSGAQADALSFPAFDRMREANAVAPQVFEVDWFKNRAWSFRRERTRVFALYASATSHSPNQPLQPTPGTGSVLNLVSPARRG